MASPIRQRLPFWYLGFSVYKGLKQCQAGTLSPERNRAMRRRCLELGRLMAMISVAEWSIAAFAYPLSLRIVNADLPTSAMLRFFFSLLLCGLVSAAYPFFVVTLFSLKSLYPVFLLSDFDNVAVDAPVLRKLGRRNAVYLVVALGPLLGIGALIADNLINEDVLAAGAEKSMAIFSAVGLLGLPCLFWMSHLIRTDLATLAGIVSSDTGRALATRCWACRFSDFP